MEDTVVDTVEDSASGEQPQWADAAAEAPWSNVQEKRKGKRNPKAKKSHSEKMETSDGYRRFMISSFGTMHQAGKSGVGFYQIWQGDKIDDDTFRFLSEQYEEWGRKMLSLDLFRKLNTTRFHLENTRRRITRMSGNKMVRTKDQPSKSGNPNQADLRLKSLEKDNVRLAEELKNLNSQFKSLAPKCFWSM